MRVLRRVAAAVVAACVAVGVLVGCGVPLSEEERVAVQAAQLKEYVAQADAWGEDIIAQLPPEEIAQDLGADGGLRSMGALYADWPKLYYWSRLIEFYPEGRTPTQVADDLVPWLEEQGWVRNTRNEFPPDDELFRRHYVRGAYRLTVEVFTVPPPHAQKINFSIVTPTTDPARG